MKTGLTHAEESRLTYFIGFVAVLVALWSWVHWTREQAPAAAPAATTVLPDPVAARDYAREIRRFGFRCERANLIFLQRGVGPHGRVYRVWCGSPWSTKTADSSLDYWVAVDRREVRLWKDQP